MESTIEKSYENYKCRVEEIYDCFKEQFGEDKIDIAFKSRCSRLVTLEEYTRLKKNLITNCLDYTIYVYWPEITITNEFNESYVIKDLYAKIDFSPEGVLLYKFKLNRATYTYPEWVSDYMHSHIGGIPKSDYSNFQSPCTGSGPINSSIHVLKDHYDKYWLEEFVFELDRYVRVESVEGVPYHRFSRISDGSDMGEQITIIPGTESRLYESEINLSLNSQPNLSKYLFDFIVCYCKSNDLNMIFNGVAFRIGDTDYQFMVKISNAFIDYINKNSTTGITVDELVRKEILLECVYKDGKIRKYAPEIARRDTGAIVLKFKGEDIHLNILERAFVRENIIYILNPNIMTRIYHSISCIVNIYFNTTHI